MDKRKSLSGHPNMILSYDLKLRSVGTRDSMSYQNLRIVVTLCCPPPTSCPLEVCPWRWESGPNG